MELKDIFSKRLRNARLMRGLSMQQLCVMMNDIVTKQSLVYHQYSVPTIFQVVTPISFLKKVILVSFLG